MASNKVLMSNYWQYSHKKLEEAHPGYAYELLQLQMAVQDDKLSVKPSISQITKLIQLYMVGVEVLESLSDPRFLYFNNKIHSLMMKKHIVTKLHQSSGKNPKDLSMTAIKKQEMKEKKKQYEMNYYFNQGQVDLRKVRQILNFAQKKTSEVEGKIQNDIKKQQDRLEERIKERKLRSENGSVKKSKVDSRQKEFKSPRKDSRMEYFDQQPINMIVGNTRGHRPLTSSVSKIIERKYGRIGNIGNRPDPRDGI